MKTLDHSALLQQECATLANVRKPTEWGDALLKLAIVLGKNGFDEREVIGPIKDECRKRGCPEDARFIEIKVKKGLAEGQSQALSAPVHIANGKAHAVGKPIWRDWIGPNPKPTFKNAKLALEEMGISPRLDIFHGRLTIDSADGTEHDICSLIGNVTDDTILRLRHLIDERFGFDVGEANTRAAVQAPAVMFNPVLDMIDEAQAAWDRKPRLDRFAADYLSAEDTELNSAVARKHMIAAVRRVRQPGCKYDVMVVLEGPEGWNKSSAIRILAGANNFSDENILGSKGKEAMEQLGGIWFHENPELTGIRKADVETVKAFLSRLVDRHRLAYGRIVTNQPRHSIEWGTTNDSQYLVSPTGNRRFAPLRLLRSIDLDKLARDRLQLIGEAAYYEAQGESLFIPESLWPLARVEQEKRREPDPWEAKLEQIPEAFVHDTADGKEQVSYADLMTYVLQIPAAQQNAAMGKRIAQAMVLNGWTKPDSPIKINGKNARGYWRYTGAQ